MILCAFHCLALKTTERQLVSQGIRVQRRRLRESVKRVDPVGRRIRTINTIKRRVYSVHSWMAIISLLGIKKNTSCLSTRTQRSSLMYIAENQNFLIYSMRQNIFYMYNNLGGDL